MLGLVLELGLGRVGLMLELMNDGVGILVEENWGCRWG